MQKHREASSNTPLSQVPANPKIVRRIETSGKFLTIFFAALFTLPVIILILFGIGSNEFFFLFSKFFNQDIVPLIFTIIGLDLIFVLVGLTMRYFPASNPDLIRRLKGKVILKWSLIVLIESFVALFTLGILTTPIG